MNKKRGPFSFACYGPEPEGYPLLSIYIPQTETPTFLYTPFQNPTVQKTFSIQDVYLAPLIFTIVSLKRRPAVTSSVLYDMDSCPLILGIAFPHTHVHIMYSLLIFIILIASE